MQQSSRTYTASGFSGYRDRNRSVPVGENWQPNAGPLLVVGPHPHDSIVGAGGLIHMWVGLGHDVTVVSVCDDEADGEYGGHPDLLRRDELRAALRKLCAIHVSVVRLGFRNGKVRSEQHRLRLAIDALLEPRMTVIAAWELKDNPDADIIGNACRASAQACGNALARCLIPTSRSTSASLREFNWRQFPLDMEAQRAKSHALQCFTSLRCRAEDRWHRSFETYLI